MPQIARRFALALCCSTFTLLNGCTVLGMVADNAIIKEDQRHRPLMEQNQPDSQEALFSQLGLEADIAIVKKVIEVVKGNPAHPETRCTMKNGIRFCYEEGAEGY